MTRKTVPYKGSKYHYYYCPTTKKRGCTDAVNLKESELCECVLEIIKSHILNLASLETLIKGSDGQQIINSIVKQYKAQIAENEEQLNKINNFKSSLYENMISGILSKEDYKALKAKYSADETRLRNAVSVLTEQLNDALDGKSERLKWLEHFKAFENLTEIDRRTVVNLIQSIRVISKTELVITFNYQDEYENALAILGEEAA